MEKITVTQDMIKHLKKTWENAEAELISILKKNMGKIISFERSSTGFYEHVEYYIWKNNRGDKGHGKLELIATDEGYNCQLSDLIEKYSEKK